MPTPQEVKLTKRLNDSLVKIVDILRNKYQYNVDATMSLGLWPNGSIVVGRDPDRDLVAPSYLQVVGHADLTGSTFHRRVSGKLRILVGPYGSRKQFPEPKDGFNHEKIAEYIAEYIDQTNKTAAANKIRTANYEASLLAIQKIKATRGSLGYNIRLSPVRSTGDVKVKVSVDIDLAPTTAEVIVAEIESTLDLRLPE